jgi:hypothetical protein
MKEVGSDFILDDLTHYVDVFKRFGVDLTDLVKDRGYSKFQVDIDTLDSYLENELSADAIHQQQWWIIKDRAYEAFGLIESDGHGFAIDGKLLAYNDYGSRRIKRGAFINLVKGNRDRVVGQLEASNFTIEVTANYEKDQQPVDDLNKYKENVLDDNNFEATHSLFINDGVTYGSGFFSIDYGRWKTNPELNQYIRRINKGEVLSLDEFYRFKRAVKGHQIKYVNTFEMITCRHARGPESVDLDDKNHRWLHRLEQIGVADAMQEYPQYAMDISPRISESVANTNPSAYYLTDIRDTITRKKTWIKFGTVQVQNVLVESPDGGPPVEFPIPVERYAIAEITRLEGIGIVDMKIDMYDHNRFPFVMWVYSTAHSHSRGIGLVKYGRDPQVLYNQLHNGMLEYVGRMAKGGGYFDSRLGISESDISDMSKPGTWKKIQVRPELGERPLRDYMLENRPASFPSVYNDLMAIERQAVDESMNVPMVYKGQRSADSGKQELILQQQADMVHSSSISMLGMCYYRFATILYSNIIQYDTDPFTFVVTDPITRQRETISMNMPSDYLMRFNNQTGEFEAIPYGVENDIRNIMFDVRVDRNSVIPTKPSERAQFYVNFFAQTAQYMNDPRTRTWLEVMNKYGLRLPGIDEAVQRLNEMDEQSSEANSQAQQQAMEAKQFNDDREYTRELIETLAKVQKTNNELANQVQGMLQQQTQ